jgi:cell division protease FtsH
VTKQAYAMVSIFGMSEKVGNVSYYDSTGQSDYTFTKPYSEKTAVLIDEEVKTLIDSQYVRAKKILRDNAEGHAKLAELLLEREVIFSEDLEEIFGKRPWEKRHLIGENGNKTNTESQQAAIESAPKVKKAVKDQKDDSDKGIVAE